MNIATLLRLQKAFKDFGNSGEICLKCREGIKDTWLKEGRLFTIKDYCSTCAEKIYKRFNEVK